jgi:hypothetical protein
MLARSLHKREPATKKLVVASHGQFLEPLHLQGSDVPAKHRQHRASYKVTARGAHFLGKREGSRGAPSTSRRLPQGCEVDDGLLFQVPFSSWPTMNIKAECTPRRSSRHRHEKSNLWRMQGLGFFLVSSG